jgi:UDP-N-acetylglucosamine 2-epimerase (non-hydrolysing)
VPVIVPRNATERPESMEFGNSILIGETRPIADMVTESLKFLKSYKCTPESVKWLGDGTTSTKIVEILMEKLT